MTTRMLSHQMAGQLKMFMSPREVLDMAQPGDIDTEHQEWSYEHAAEKMWSRKRGHAERTGLAASIQAEGVHEPVKIMHGWYGAAGRGPVLYEGHHRTISQLDADPDRLMPVLHKEAFR